MRGRRPGGKWRTESEETKGEGNRRRQGINAEREISDCWDIFLLLGITHAPRERKEAGTMPPAASGTASSWFAGRAKKPADGEVSLATGFRLL